MNARWRYQDARGVWVEGVYERHSDRGGRDVTYFFRRDDGQLDLVSGSRLQAAQCLRLRCQCEIDHDRVGTHPAFHGNADAGCQNYGTEKLTSDYGTFLLCPPCAEDALSGGYYRRAK